jgi:hypothetical protein
MGVVVVALAALGPLARSIGVTLAAVVAAPLLLAPSYAGHQLYPSSDSLWKHATLFDRLRPRVAPDWRTFVVANDPGRYGFALMHKSASLFGIPTVTDYEPQTAQRFAEFVVMMRTSRTMRSVNAFYYPIGGWMGEGFNRNLLDLTAARYVLAQAGNDDVTTFLKPPPDLIEQEGALHVYENPSALPRALWIPRLQVVGRPNEMLRQLAFRWVDPWDVALVEVAPASGFVGDATTARARPGPRPTFVRDDAEVVVIDVQAPQRGFLLLADQYRAGWRATVNGVPVPIERANYAFRVVEVPAGDSRVEFRYEPRSLRVGAFVSALALAGALAALALSRPRRAGRPGPAGSTA